jgi:hypothetical protein
MNKEQGIENEEVFGFLRVFVMKFSLPAGMNYQRSIFY